MASYPAAEAEQWPQTHHTTTSMFDCWCEVLFMKYCTSFTLDVSGNLKKKGKKRVISNNYMDIQHVYGCLIWYAGQVQHFTNTDARDKSPIKGENAYHVGFFLCVKFHRNIQHSIFSILPEFNRLKNRDILILEMYSSHIRQIKFLKMAAESKQEQIIYSVRRETHVA